ncbi:germin-like protein subfamily 1 member 11 isoform X1 [Prunus yedoensis var. nudiflora]|uniref:Germin-like protein n=1 Tax=Prunus yedoensis var. nudiflora TaxID=2094558 RepID=A0A314YGV0_PRUYE|nr:germin-like protein subfamily 1 member 11 isoform X1 [Prunus yedoensis var. nudiflora]
MKGVHFLISTLAILASATFLVSASDPSSLQDFCVALNDTKSAAVNVDNLLGLNTLGLSLARIDFAPNGLNPPHTHPRATEILVVLEGTLCWFRHIQREWFVFPIGLIHFQLNVGKVNAVAFAGLSSQNPGVITIAKAVFGSQPPINPDVLAKAFQVDDNVVDYLQKQFGTTTISKIQQ